MKSVAGNPKFIWYVIALNARKIHQHDQPLSDSVSNPEPKPGSG
jgi:hypothetical protein